MSADDEPAVDEWRREGTCGACVHFQSDFGAPPKLFGHCKMFRRSGSRGSSDATCGEFKPLPGFGEKIVLAAPTVAPSSRSAALRAQHAARSAPAPPRRRRQAGAGPRIVRRRAGAEDGERRITRDTRLVSDGLLAAFVGEEGGETVDRDTLRDVLLEVMESYIAIDDVELAPKWAGGTMTLQPEDPDLKPQVVPVETFFHKIVMLRDRLRVLEAKVNGNKRLEPAEKVQLQQYISQCYGSLTTFNTLFRNKEDKFSSK